MTRGARVVIASALLLGAVPAVGSGPASAQPTGNGTGGTALAPIGSFSSPTYATAAPGFGKLTFVTEQAGTVRVLRNGGPLSRPFLDITALVGCGSPGEPACGERGLLSIAFPPDYKQSRRFYAYYTDGAGDLNIDEFRRSRTPTFARAATRRSVLHISHPGFANHNGGQLQFRGRYLFAGTGDGGSGGDPPNNAQNLDSLLGKLLRIDPRNPKGPRAYRIPRSNPFVDLPGRDEIFSYGFRNPYRFSFDERSHGPDRIAIGDVGQVRFEEVDLATLPAARSANFGWDAFEGFAPYNCGILQCPNGDTPDPGGTTFPVLAYGRDRGCGVIGGYVVRDKRLATLYRRYIYVDLCEGQLRSFIPSTAGAIDDRPLGVPISTPVSFGRRPNGALYVVSLTGPVYRLVPG